LKWPSFYQTSITQRDWDAADAAGRIKVEVSAGFREQIDGKPIFTALSTSVCFAFFPAPMGMSSRSISLRFGRSSSLDSHPTDLNHDLLPPSPHRGSTSRTCS
jgi:hypothetical protein